MAYQKLQLETAAKAIPSDDVLIPVPTSPHFSTIASAVVGSVITCDALEKETGTAAALSGDSVGTSINNGIRLIDAAATFIANGVVPNDKFTSTAGGTINTRVKFVVSDTELVLENVSSGTVIAPGDTYSVFNQNNFLDTCQVGDTVVSNTAAQSTFITAIASEVEITVNTIGAIAGTDNLTIFTDPEANLGCILYVGGLGNIKVRTASGQDVTYIGLNASSWVPIQIIKLYSTGTTATNMVVNW